GGGAGGGDDDWAGTNRTGGGGKRPGGGIELPRKTGGNAHIPVLSGGGAGGRRIRWQGAAGAGRANEFGELRPAAVLPAEPGIDEAVLSAYGARSRCGSWCAGDLSGAAGEAGGAA